MKKKASENVTRGKHRPWKTVLVMYMQVVGCALTVQKYIS